MSDFYPRIKQAFASQYNPLDPKTPAIQWEKVTCDKVLELPRSVLIQAQNFVKNLHDLSHRNDYITASGLENKFPFYKDINNDSLLMAYDFHINEDNQLKLIEVNTNASGYLIADLVYKCFPDNPYEEALDLLHQAFLNEFKLSQLPNNEKVFIVDEDIEQQKMAFEFYLYKDLLQQWGIESEILDFRNLHWEAQKLSLLTDKQEEVRFIYNRYCDFLLEKEISHPMLQSFAKGKTTLSPNPIEYYLLADKQRMIELSDSEWAHQHLSEDSQKLLCELKNNLILTHTLDSFTSVDELWKLRKSLFFKPKRSHGGKATYRGKNITKKVFETLNEKDFLAQDFVPAPEVEFGDGRWKYELRFFVYQDQIQLASPRFYQGQVTNFSLDNGGFGRVVFS